MPTRTSWFLACLFLGILVHPISGFSQTESAKPFSRVGIAVTASTLGFGAEAASPLSSRFNLRAGFNLFNYDRDFHEDGLSYAAQLRFRSSEAHFDWFPFGGSFHVSPGVLVYNGNQLAANASVPAGQTFTLNHVKYASDGSDPITGTGKVDFAKAGPMFTLGWGNLIPRNHRRFSVPLEFGFVYTGAPRTSLNLKGTACDPSGLGCLPVDSFPEFQANVQAERDTLNKDMSAFRFYPIISAGFGVSF